jgi:hypothetical protein
MVHGKVAQDANDDGVSSSAYGVPELTVSTVFSSYDPGQNSSDLDTVANSDGLCEVCHVGATTTAHNGNAGDPGHGTTDYRGQDCTKCHKHAEGFKGGGHEAGADCKGCHVDPQGTRRDIQVEFDKSFQHGNTWNNLQSTDCEKCHDEPSSDGDVVLKVWDANATAGSANFTTVTYTAATAATANAFCLSCHDADTTKIIFTGNETEPPDIETRWNDTSTAGYNKYPPGANNTTKPNTVPVVNKAYSPHAMPITNVSKPAGQMTALPATWGSRTISDAAPVACLDCHPAHGSNLASGVNATMGTGGKMLFDDNGALTTEENLCWTCHTKGMDYYGDDTTNNQSWRGNWLGYVPYKRGGFRSSHFFPSKTNTWTLAGTAPSDSTGTAQTGVPTGTRTSVYCSTCHNPHGVSSTGDSNPAYRLPILRGTWLTAPYKEDRAPGATQDTTGVFTSEISNNFSGPLPRTVPSREQSDAHPGRGYAPQASATGHEGFFIDQNTFAVGTYITESDTLFAGLCMTCHSQSTLTGLTWKGHRSVKGWGTTDTANMDLLQSQAGTRSGQGSGIVIDGVNSTEWAFQYYGGTGVNYNWGDSDRAWGSRNKDRGGSPRDPQIASRYAYQAFPWGVNGTTAGKIQYGRQTSTTAPAYTQQSFHQFPCSKCHTPHASRLPRLMVTNCLDNGDGTGTPGSATGFTASPWRGNQTGTHTPPGTTLYTNMVTNGNAQNPEAPNCHATGTSYSSGWNSVTPW